MRNIMGVTVLPYIDQTQTARLQEAASANIQTPKNTDEAVTTFKECLASAERSVQACLPPATVVPFPWIRYSRSLDLPRRPMHRLIRLRSRIPRQFPVLLQQIVPPPPAVFLLRRTSKNISKKLLKHTVWISTCSKPLPSRNPISIHPQPALPVPWVSCS